MDTYVHPSDRTTRTLSALDWTALILVVIGGINWGLVGLFDFDLVAAIFGDLSGLSRFVYVLVGIAAIYCAVAIPAARRIRTRTPAHQH